MVKKKYPKIKHTTKLEDIFNDDSIDAVVISTPIKSHYKLSLKALNSNKHVFVEKPFTTKLSESKKLIYIARMKNLTIFVGHIYLYHPIYRKLKNFFVKDPPIFANFYWSTLGSFKENILFDFLSHDVSLILKIFGNPKKITLINSKGFFTKSDTITIKFDINSTKSCIVNINRIFHEKKKTILFQTKNNLLLWDRNVLYRFNKKNSSYQNYFQITKTPLEIECSEFLKTISKHKNDLSNAQHALDVIKILSKISLSDKK